jgi:hypothetical protein
MNYIARIARRTVTRLLPASARDVRCTGCGAMRDARNPMLSGPGIYLCHACFRGIAASLTPRRPPDDAVRCHFCRQFRAPDDVGRAGAVAVCADCLGTMDVAFEGAGASSADR